MLSSMAVVRGGRSTTLSEKKLEQRVESFYVGKEHQVLNLNGVYGHVEKVGKYRDSDVEVVLSFYPRIGPRKSEKFFRPGKKGDPW